MKVKVPQDAEVTAMVEIEPPSEGGFGVTAALTISLPGLARGDAERLVEAAHQTCPYSNAIRNNIDVELTIV